MNPVTNPVARPAGRTLIALALATTVLAGCGGSSTSSPSAPAVASVSSSSQNSSAPSAPPTTTAPSAPTTSTATPQTQTTGSSAPAPAPVSIEASIPGQPTGGQIPSRYTCDGGDVSLPLKWSGVPHGTVEIAIFLLNLQYVHGKPFVGWAVAGINPASHGISAGALPAGAVVGRNSFGRVGYSICPPKGAGHETYIVRVTALSRRLPLSTGFNGEAVYNEAERYAKAVGLAGGTYKRR
jgi:phosphatidylethanolamine-binding protein (PEBP) family uncharacterized protein